MASEFEHEPYNSIPISDDSIVGGIERDISEICNAMQRVGLAQGLSMRPAAPIPRTNAAHYDHLTLKRMIDTADAGQAYELGHLWNDLGNEIMDFGESLQRTATGSEAIWVGQAGNAARAALDTLATWCQHTGHGVQFMGTTVRTQAEAAQTRSKPCRSRCPTTPRSTRLG